MVEVGWLMIGGESGALIGNSGAANGIFREEGVDCVMGLDVDDLL